jgi:predicted nucleic acid-binding Zn ribbon protein
MDLVSSVVEAASSGSGLVRVQISAVIEGPEDRIKFDRLKETLIRAISMPLHHGAELLRLAPTSAPWSLEGGYRNALRSSAAAGGTSWQRADRKAAAMVERARKLANIEAPNPEADDERPSTCAHCGTALPQRQSTAPGAVRLYCDSCAVGAARWDRMKARNLVKAPDRLCKCCGAVMEPTTPLRPLVCSEECRAALRQRSRNMDNWRRRAREKATRPSRPCAVCGELMPSTTNTNRRICDGCREHRQLGPKVA